MKNWYWWLIGLIVLIGAIYLGYYMGSNQANVSNDAAEESTMDAGDADVSGTTDPITEDREATQRDDGAEWVTYASSALDADITYPKTVEWPDGRTEELSASPIEGGVALMGDDGINVSFTRQSFMGDETLQEAIDRIWPGPPGIPAYQIKRYLDGKSFVLILLGHDYPPAMESISDWVSF